jgi:hypothetical protein
VPTKTPTPQALFTWLAEHPQVIHSGVATAFPIEAGLESLGVVEHVLQTDDRRAASPTVPELATKQPLDATLTAFAAYNTNGLIVQTAADTFTGRSIAAGSAKITISNGNGVSGNPTIDLGSVASTDLSNSSNIMLLTGAQTVTGAKTFNAGTFLDKGGKVYDVRAVGTAPALRQPACSAPILLRDFRSALRPALQW